MSRSFPNVELIKDVEKKLSDTVYQELERWGWLEDKDRLIEKLGIIPTTVRFFLEKHPMTIKQSLWVIETLDLEIHINIWRCRTPCPEFTVLNWPNNKSEL